MFLVKPTNRPLRYAAALRQRLAAELLRRGPTPLLCRRLRGVVRFETCVRPPDPTPVDARAFADEVLSAAVFLGMARGDFCAVRLTGQGVYRLDERLYRQLLLSLFRAGLRQGGGTLALFFDAAGIRLRCGGFRPDGDARRFAARMGGVTLGLSGQTPGGLLVLPTPVLSASEAATGITGPPCAAYLRDPLSDVQLYFAP